MSGGDKIPLDYQTHLCRMLSQLVPPGQSKAATRAVEGEASAMAENHAGHNKDRPNAGAAVSSLIVPVRASGPANVPPVRMNGEAPWLG